MKVKATGKAQVKQSRSRGKPKKQYERYPPGESPAAVGRMAGCSRPLAHRLLKRGMTPEEIVERCRVRREQEAGKGKAAAGRRTAAMTVAASTATPARTNGNNRVDGHPRVNGHAGHAPVNGLAEPFFAAQARKETALACLREVELAQKRGQLIPVGVVNVFMAGLIVKAREALMRIGPELQDRLAAETNPAICHELIDQEIRRALYGLSLFGERWQNSFEGEGPRSEEMRRLIDRMVELVEGVRAVETRM